MLQTVVQDVQKEPWNGSADTKSE